MRELASESSAQDAVSSRGGTSRERQRAGEDERGDRMNGDPFVTHRRLLFTVAYEMLGSAVDAEDVVQDAWLKWRDVEKSTVHDPRAYLVRMVTRKALDQLRAASRRREEYVGPWLPEPLLTSPDVAEHVELADSLSTAMLLVLETLTPTQRAVFVLHEVFAFGYDELAEAVGKTPAAVRQIAHRAREHVAARKPRGEVSSEVIRQALQAFQRALTTGDIQQLAEILAPDVVLLGDGGGIKQALPRPIHGADKVVKILRLGSTHPLTGRMTIEPVQVNGRPALLARLDGVVDSVVSVQVSDGLVTGIYTVRNPEKLSRILSEAEVGF